MKKIISMIFMVMFAAAIFAQDATLTIGEVTANPDETVTIPVTVSSDTPLLATEFNIDFDISVLDEASISYIFNDDFPEYEWFFNVQNGQLLLNWVSASFVAKPINGTMTLFEVQADFVGGATDLEWSLSILADQDGIEIPHTAINGSVGEPVQPEITLELPELVAAPGTTVNIPVTISGASADGTPIIAAEFNIDFDNTVLDYSSIEFVNYSELMPDYEWVVNAINGQILVNWVQSALMPLEIPDGTVMFEVEADFIGGETDLMWTLAIVVDGNSQEVPTTTIDGSISSSTPGATAFFGTGNWNNAAFWTNGVPGATSLATIESGEAIVDANALALDVIISAGAALTVEATGNLAIGNDLILESNTDNAPSGSFINNGTVTVNGESSMQRWLSGGENHFISLPVSGLTLNALYNPSNPGYFYEYVEPTKLWSNLYELNTPLMTAKGYALNFDNDEMIEINGDFNMAASYDANISYTEDKGGDDGWNLVGNPYTSALDWESEAWTKTNLEGGIYFYDGTNYQAYNGGYGVPATASQYVPAMQGFFVKAYAAGAELSVPKAAQVHSAQEYFKGRNSVNALRLKMEYNSLSDEALIRFAESASEGFDSDMDAYKLYSFNADVPQVFSIGTTYQTINALPEQGAATWDEVVVNLGFKTGNYGEYTITASDLESFTAGQVNTIELYDDVTEEYVDLLEHPTYTFTADAGMNTSRFKVYFNRSIVGVEDMMSTFAEIYSMEKTIFIKNASGVAHIYSLSGQEIMRAELNDNVLNTIYMTKCGMFIVKVVDGNQGIAVEKVYLR